MNIEFYKAGKSLCYLPSPYPHVLIMFNCSSSHQFTDPIRYNCFPFQSTGFHFFFLQLTS